MSNSYSPFRSQPSYHFCQEVLPALPQPSSHLSLLKNSLFNVCLPSHLKEAAKGQGLSYHLASLCQLMPGQSWACPAPAHIRHSAETIKPRIWGGPAGNTSLFQEPTPQPCFCMLHTFQFTKGSPIDFCISLSPLLLEGSIKILGMRTWR